MRFYQLTITDPDNPSKVLASYGSLNANGSNNGSALKIEFDIPVYAYGGPVASVWIKISGVNFEDVRAAKNLNKANVKLIGGMSKGLPLATPSQSGVLLVGEVQQCYGNWQGTEISLELIVNYKEGTPTAPVNLSYDWRKGTPMQEMIAKTLGIAYPGSKVTGSIDASLVYTEDAPFFYQTLSQFASFIHDTSKIINTDPAYLGVSIVQTPDGFNVFDGTEVKPAKKITYFDMIGNGTWLDVATMQFKTVLRADINVGDTVELPLGINTINTVSSWTQYRDTSSFQGRYYVNRIRHIGDSRQPDANSWVTVFDAIVPGPQ